MPRSAPTCRTRPRCGSSPPVTPIRTPSSGSGSSVWPGSSTRHSHGAWGETEAQAILATAEATIRLWAEELAFPDLAEDMAVEARLALALAEEITELDERITTLVRERDPHGIIISAPGVGAVTGAVILGRLGDAGRFRPLVAVRSFSGLVPSLDASGVRQAWSTNQARRALLREALFTTAPSKPGVPINPPRPNSPSCKPPVTDTRLVQHPPSTQCMKLSARTSTSSRMRERSGLGMRTGGKVRPVQAVKRKYDPDNAFRLNRTSHPSRRLPGASWQYTTTGPPAAPTPTS
jgi:hypothetical protein